MDYAVDGLVAECSWLELCFVLCSSGPWIRSLELPLYVEVIV